MILLQLTKLADDLTKCWSRGAHSDVGQDTNSARSAPIENDGEIRFDGIVVPKYEYF